MQAFVACRYSSFEIVEDAEGVIFTFNSLGDASLGGAEVASTEAN